ncbi:uncharacterized protein H6S33_004712 [Morchella sextelata]|uniref:uncharacterized protein n=1 Tax=Morchella sextelata TaxID=1174677 RepID=UPI001D03BBB9|nr:uncharacterized protein H6S33_004712 [Morchella sextelata]KAH0605490.1 hypothetical protein H6S33_004712 [Morchella sextelata]
MSDHAAKTSDHYTSFFARAHPLTIEHTTAASYLNDLKGRVNSVLAGVFEGETTWWPMKDYERPLEEGEVRLRWNSAAGEQKCCGTELTWIVPERYVEKYQQWLEDVSEPTSPAFAGAEGGCG